MVVVVVCVLGGVFVLVFGCGVLWWFGLVVVCWLLCWFFLWFFWGLWVVGGFWCGWGGVWVLVEVGVGFVLGVVGVVVVGMVVVVGGGVVVGVVLWVLVGLVLLFFVFVGCVSCVYVTDRGLAVFDMDWTLIVAEVFDELAKAAGVG
ncbi:hypothetical protein RA263_27435, partial [Pseudomonas syringae pv. tagetis]